MSSVILFTKESSKSIVGNDGERQEEGKETIVAGGEAVVVVIY